MEENRKKSRKGLWRTLAIVAGTALVCYEIFSRKGQDVKNACGWVKDRFSNKSTSPEVSNNSYQNNSGGGNWNNKQRRN